MDLELEQVFKKYRFVEGRHVASRLEDELEALAKLPPPTVDRTEFEQHASRLAACEASVKTLSARVAQLEPDADRDQLRIRLAARVREEAAKIAGVTGAWISATELSFIVTANEWTPELSAAGADLASALQRELSPTRYIDGGFEEERGEMLGWCRVYP